MPLLERAMEAGGEGPPVLLGPGALAKPLMLMLLLEPPEFGGEARLDRPLGKGPSSAAWYFETENSLPTTETGDSGALRPALMLMMVKGSQGGDGNGSSRWWCPVPLRSAGGRRNKQASASRLSHRGRHTGPVEMQVCRPWNRWPRLPHKVGVFRGRSGATSQ